ncbi:ectoine hydroxylase [Salipaludibacillus neizhouensis]|uniref:Ectoine hydroxylase n=1 Tax=Salipaludibacillus neizhouensis TaxID=885475 RepID=A0A3A9K4Q2_9BACI|nr:ectoine hydroxylase [Salipaludibacillus neizhouensis]RKL66318.1 ectoine hydroxylase [Salipaludibacillus neizhouensis]
MHKDFYPSRTGENAGKITNRKDPVVYGNAAEGPLDKNDLDYYNENGYLLYDDLFNEEELKVMQEGLQDILNKNEKKEADHIIREPGSNEIRSVFEIHKDDPFFKSLSKNKRIVQIAEQLLGSQVYIMQSRINFKPGFKGKEFYWHSDFETWHVEDGMPNMRAVSCSIVLTDNHEFNGPIMLIPGSHKWYVSCPGKTEEDNYKTSLKKQESGVPENKKMEKLVEEANGQIDRAVGPAGSVLFFDCNTMHGSAGNISPFPRSNVFFVFNSIENKLVEPFGTGQPRPEFLANRENIKPIKPETSTFRKSQYA